MQKSKEFKVFPAEGGYVIVRRVSREQAEAMERREVCRRDFCTKTGELLGFRVIGVESRRVDGDLQSIRSTSTISRSEMELNLARSRTFRLSEEQRLQLIRDGHAPEDAIERVHAKVRVYVQLGSAKGDILRVWPR